MCKTLFLEGGFSSSWGDFGFNLSKKGTLIFFTKNNLSPLGFLKTVLTSGINLYGFFSRAFFSFHGRNFQKISRTLKSIFTHVISKIFSRRRLGFHGHFSRFFHGDLSTFTDRSLKISTHGKKYSREKKKCIFPLVIYIT